MAKPSPTLAAPEDLFDMKFVQVLIARALQVGLCRLWQMDAEEFLFTDGEHRSSKRYDVIIHDLFSARNPSALLRRAILQRLRDAWLDAETGVLIVNFLGYHDPSASAEAASGYPLGSALARSLRQVFPTVRCYREVPLDHDTGSVANIMCWASARPWRYEPPTTGEFADAQKFSPQWATRHYQQWEVLREQVDDNDPLPADCDPLEVRGEVSDSGSDSSASCARARREVEVAHAVVAEAMWTKVSSELLPYPGLWAETGGERQQQQEL